MLEIAASNVNCKFLFGVILFKCGPGILAGFLEVEKKHLILDFTWVYYCSGLKQVYWQDFWRQTGDIWYRIFTWVYHCSGLDQVDRRHLIQFIYLCILLLRSGPGILAGFLEADRRHLMQDIYLNISFRNSRCDNIYSPIVSLNFRRDKSYFDEMIWNNERRGGVLFSNA